MFKKCSVEGCGKEYEARGLCQTHYMQLRRKNPDMPLRYQYGPVEERISSHFTRGSDHECWVWTKLKNRAGYGMISTQVGMALGHRVMWEMANSQKIPPKMVVMHTCDNPACVNPAHLRLGTQLENLKDMQAKRRHVVPHARGEDHHDARLTEAKVRHIRSCNESNYDLADKYGVSPSTIGKIRRRVTWKHIE